MSDIDCFDGEPIKFPSVEASENRVSFVYGRRLLNENHCRHDGSFQVDADAHEVLCVKCGKTVDPFHAIKTVAATGSWLDSKIAALTQLEEKNAAREYARKSRCRHARWCGVFGRPWRVCLSCNAVFEPEKHCGLEIDGLVFYRIGREMMSTKRSDIVTAINRLKEIAKL